MNEIVAAIIGGLFGLFTPLIVIYAKDRKEKERKADNYRALRLSGRWNGTFITRLRLSNDVPDSYPLLVEFDIRNRTPKGKGIFEINKFKYEIALEPKPENENFLSVHYRSKDRNIILWGTMVLRVDALGNKMSGEFIGYGAISEGIIGGRVELTKEQIR